MDWLMVFEYGLKFVPLIIFSLLILTIGIDIIEIIKCSENFYPSFVESFQ